MIKVTVYKNGDSFEGIFAGSTTIQAIADQFGINPKVNPVYVNGDRENDLNTQIAAYGLAELNITSVFKVTNGNK